MKNRLVALSLALALAVTCAVSAASAPPAAAVSCTVTVNLAPGAVNPSVLCLEQRLVELGYTVGTPDTSYGAASQAAVKAFQTSRGMYPHGTVTSITARQLGLRGALPSGPAVPRVTVLGDSTSAAMRWYDEANGSSEIYDVMGTSTDLVWSVESCRRLVSASCRGRTDTVTNIRMTPVSALPLMQGALRGQLGQALVVMAGYDDWTITSAIDQIVNEARTQGVTRVFWLNYRIGPGTYAYKKYYVAHNADLERAKARHPNLVVLDWNTYSSGRTSWFEADGIHLTKAGGKALAEYLKVAVDASDVDECLAANASAGVADPTTGEPAEPTVGPSGFAGTAPTRVLDSREGVGARVGAGRTVTLDLDGLAPSLVPAGATSVALQVTAVSPCASGYLTAFACGVRPATSSLNYVSGRTTTGLAISLLEGRNVCIHTSAASHITVDVAGAFAPSGDLFHTNPGGPVRWVDTRGEPAVSAISGILTDGAAITVPIAGAGDVPADASAVWLNVAAVSRSGPVQLVLLPGACTVSTPTSLPTSVSAHTGRAAATSVVVPLADGAVCVRATGGAVHAVIDLSGWFGGPAIGGLDYRAEAPTRVVDTRPASLVAPGGTVRVTATTVTVMNVAAIGSSGFGFTSAKPCGVTAVSSFLNTAPGETVSNLGAVDPGAEKAVCISPSVSSHLAVDVTGRFEIAG